MNNTTIIMTGFGARLKAEREKNNLSKVALSNKIGVHYSQIGRYERDEASPSADVLKKLANELGVTTDYLMNGTKADMAEEKMKDKKLMNLFNRVSELNKEEQKIVTALIDAFLFQKEMKNRLNN
jgi:transcriptional regulator with XRE-family HTH domain